MDNYDESGCCAEAQYRRWAEFRDEYATNEDWRRSGVRETRRHGDHRSVSCTLTSPESPPADQCRQQDPVIVIDDDDDDDSESTLTSPEVPPDDQREQQDPVVYMISDAESQPANGQDNGAESTGDTVITRRGNNTVPPVEYVSVPAECRSLIGLKLRRVVRPTPDDEDDEYSYKIRVVTEWLKNAVDALEKEKGDESTTKSACSSSRP